MTATNANNLAAVETAISQINRTDDQEGALRAWAKTIGGHAQFERLSEREVRRLANKTVAAADRVAEMVTRLDRTMREMLDSVDNPPGASSITRPPNV
jgi:hypothetical protein